MNDFSNVRDSGSWEFGLSSESREAIEALVKGINSQDCMAYFDLLLEDCWAALRSQSPAEEAALRRYYIEGGWKSDAVFE